MLPWSKSWFYYTDPASKSIGLRRYDEMYPLMGFTTMFPPPPSCLLSPLCGRCMNNENGMKIEKTEFGFLRLLWSAILFVHIHQLTCSVSDVKCSPSNPIQILPNHMLRVLHSPKLIYGTYIDDYYFGWYGLRREGIFTLATSKQLAATTSLNA